MDSVVIAEVKKAPFWEYVDVEGLVYPFKTIQVNAMENGFVERVVAEEGAMLQQGDTILVLQNPELYHSIDDEQDAWSSKLRNCQEQEIEMTHQPAPASLGCPASDGELEEIAQAEPGGISYGHQE